jgi:hypothetical protein
VPWNAAAGAAVGADRELGPERVARLDLELGAVAGLGRVEPRLHRLPRARVATLGEEERLEPLELAPAEVVLPPLQHRDGHRPLREAGGDGDVLVEELLLQRLGRDRGRERGLLRPRLVAEQHMGQRTAAPEHVLHGAKPTRANGRSLPQRCSEREKPADCDNPVTTALTCLGRRQYRPARRIR